MDRIQLSTKPRHRGEGLESINIRIIGRNQQHVVNVSVDVAVAWNWPTFTSLVFSFVTGIYISDQ